jgi:senataxin
MMERSESSSKMMKKKEIPNDHGFYDTIFSWSLEDIFNENLFKVFTFSTFHFHHSLFSYLFCKITLLVCVYYLQLLDYFTEQ